jgi:hypothetical protein
MCPGPWLPVSVELTTGVIGGEYEDTKSVEHCFMLSKTINVPGAANSFAFDTNTAGDMVYETLNSSAT